MSDTIYNQLVTEVKTMLPKLPENRRTTIVANYYKTTVRVGFQVDAKADCSEITSADTRSPVDNVVARLTPWSDAITGVRVKYETMNGERRTWETTQHTDADSAITELCQRTKVGNILGAVLLKEHGGFETVI